MPKPSLESPKFLAENSLFLAKTYKQLKNNEEAKKYCNVVLEFTKTDSETENVCFSILMTYIF